MHHKSNWHRVRQACLLTAGVLTLTLTAGQAFAWHAERVRRIAHELEAKARHVHRQAELEVRRPDRIERRAIQLLHALEDRARHYHHQVERRYSSPEHTRHDFQELVRVYSRAERIMHRAHFSYHVMHDFWAVSDMIWELRYEYGGHGHDDHRGGHGDGRGRHGH